MMALDSKKTKPDFGLLVHRLLSFVRYGRLALILACLGALGGVIIYSYSTPVYFARSVVNLAGVSESHSTMVLRRKRQVSTYSV